MVLAFVGSVVGKVGLGGTNPLLFALLRGAGAGALLLLLTLLPLPQQLRGSKGRNANEQNGDGRSKTPLHIRNGLLSGFPLFVACGLCLIFSQAGFLVSTLCTQWSFLCFVICRIFVL